MERTPVIIFLRIVGVLLLVFGVVAIFSLSIDLEHITMGGLFTLSGVLGIAVAALSLASGMLVLMFAGARERAGMLAVLSICLLALVALNLLVTCLIYALRESGFSWQSFVSLVLPVLFLAGAVKNRDTAGE